MSIEDRPSSPRRRRILQAAATLVSGPLPLRFARAQEAGLAPYLQAKINWRQAEGESIAVAVIPTSYFDNLIAVTPQFEALTGIKVRYDRVPPAEIRRRAMGDLAAKTGMYATSATDPMYYPLYVSNKWIDPLDAFLGDGSLTDGAWFRYDDLLRAWREANSVGGKPYGIPYDGEVTLQVYRKDLYDAQGLKPAETLGDYLRNAQAVHDPSNRMWGAAMRGHAGAGQNMYIYPSIFRAFGGKWLADDGRVRVNSPAAVAALDWYVHMQRKYAPVTVRDWNWPDIAEAFAQGTLGAYVDAHSTATVLNSAQTSKVVGKIGYARWPKGPTGRRTASVWNWGFPINASLSPRAKRATWLFITWATSGETQARTSWKFPGAARRLGVNRLSLWRSAEFFALMKPNGHNFVEAAVESLEIDTDPDWRPRVPQWPAIGETMAAAIHTVLVGDTKSRASLDQAQTRIEQLMKA